MRWRSTIVALVAAYGMIPGAAEFVENLTHLVSSGHLAHAVHDEEHERQGSEHGCSGAAHLCSCCPAVHFVPSRPGRAGREPMGKASPSLPTDQLATEGHLPAIFRPPIA